MTHYYSKSFLSIRLFFNKKALLFPFFFFITFPFYTMTESPYTLDKLRSTLIRLEDTIIFGKYILYAPHFYSNLKLNILLLALIERAQFAMNPCIYKKGALEFNGATGDRNFLEYFFWETEKVHGKALLKQKSKKRVQSTKPFSQYSQSTSIH